MKFAQLQKEVNQQVESFKSIIQDVRSKRDNLVEGEAVILQNMLNDYEQEQSNLQSTCQNVANEIKELRKNFKKLEDIRNSFETVKRQLLSQKTKMSQLLGDYKVILSKLHQRGNQQQRCIQHEQNDRSEIHNQNQSKSRPQIHGLGFDLQESNNSMVISIKSKRFEIAYDKTNEKWMARDSNHLVAKAVGQFNLHNDLGQLVATLRYISTLP